MNFLKYRPKFHLGWKLYKGSPVISYHRQHYEYLRFSINGMENNRISFKDIDKVIIERVNLFLSVCEKHRIYPPLIYSPCDDVVELVFVSGYSNRFFIVQFNLNDIIIDEVKENIDRTFVRKLYSQKPNVSIDHKIMEIASDLANSYNNSVFMQISAAASRFYGITIFDMI